MKNRGTWLLLSLTVLFVGITAGVFVHRSNGEQPVLLSVVQKGDPLLAVAPAGSPGSDESQSENPEAAPSLSGPVNINTADLELLTTLPGIGPVLAQRIIDYREAHGSFQYVEELTYVNGIGQKRLEAILDYVTVGG